MGRRHTATCTGTGGAAASGAEQNKWAFALRSKTSGHFWVCSTHLISCFPFGHLISFFPPSQANTRLSCTFSHFFLAALPGEIRLFQRAGGRHTQPGRVHRGAQVGAGALNSTLQSKQQLQLQGCCQHSEGLFFLQPEGSFCSRSHGLMLKHSQSFLERRVRARLGAGCWHPPLPALFAFYGPLLASQ